MRVHVLTEKFSVIETNCDFGFICVVFYFHYNTWLLWYLCCHVNHIDTSYFVLSFMEFINGVKIFKTKEISHLPGCFGN